MAKTTIDEEEIVAQIIDETRLAANLCLDGRRDLTEMLELLQTLKDFNYEATKISAAQQPTEPPIPAVAKPAARPALSGPGFHISNKIIVESTKSKPEPGKKPKGGKDDANAKPISSKEDTVLLKTENGAGGGVPARPSQTDLPAVSPKPRRQP